jgi:hypothetical protein
MSRWHHAVLPLAVLALSSAAHAQIGGSAAGQWSMIPLTSFQPVRQNAAYELASDGSSAYHTRRGDDGAFQAPFGLPAGSRVHEVCVFAYDNTPSNELSLAVAYTELGDATRDAIGGTRIDTYAATGMAAKPRYTRLCTIPSPALVLNTYGDVNGDGIPGWLTWSIQVEPVAWGYWPLIGWGGAAVRWSPPAAAAVRPTPADIEPSR